MATTKKVIIPKASLPSVNALTEEYVVRFRVVSDDRNRVSHWSPQYFVPLEQKTLAETNIVTVGNGLISVAWSANEDPGTVYDIYAAWGFENASSVGTVYPDQSPEVIADPTLLEKYYYKSVVGNNVIFFVPPGALAVKIYVQKVSYPKGVIATSRLIAESPVTEL